MHGLTEDAMSYGRAAGHLRAAFTAALVAVPLSYIVALLDGVRSVLPVVVTPLGDAVRMHEGVAGVTPLLVFFCFVWTLWLSKFALARMCKPLRDVDGVTAGLRTSVIAPVYSEPEALFRRVLESVRDNRPSEVIVVVDGGDPGLARIASEYADRVVSIPKSGKRQALRQDSRRPTPPVT